MFSDSDILLLLFLQAAFAVRPNLNRVHTKSLLRHFSGIVLRLRRVVNRTRHGQHEENPSILLPRSKIRMVKLETRILFMKSSVIFSTFLQVSAPNCISTHPLLMHIRVFTPQTAGGFVRRNTRLGRANDPPNYVKVSTPTVLRGHPPRRWKDEVFLYVDGNIGDETLPIASVMRAYWINMSMC